MRSRLLVPVLALAFCGAIAACDNDITDIGEGFDDTASWRANLDASQEVPTPNVTGATPSGRAWFTDHGTTLTYYMEYDGLTTNANNAHIHRGAAGASGPALVQLLFVTRQAGVVSGTVDMTLADVAFPANEVVTPDSLRTLLNNGNAYVNIHTTQNGPGEIRGQVQRN